MPAVEAQDAPDTLTIQNGFRLKQVASEPLMADPVDACFDASGNLYVAEMHGYPFSFEPRQRQPQGGGKKDAGIIRLLEDTNDDGVFDQSHIFADQVSWPTSVCCYDGGVYVLAPSKLYYFKDTDGDHRADVRQIIFTGFGRQNVQGLANNLKWGLDHRIYGSVGSNGANLTQDGKPYLNLGRRDFAYDPVTNKMEPLSGGVQFGNSMDDWGHRFVCSNSDHIRNVVFPLRYLERNPSLSTSSNVRSVAKEGGAAPVFRTSPAEPWRIVRTRRRAADPKFNKRLPSTELVPIGFFTSAVSVTIYRGDAFPEDYRGNVFIGDVGGNLVHRKTLTPNKSSFVAERADEGVEFITSTDTWFRPTNFINAPDGSLYILDMYRETIEHPVSIPEDIKAYLDLESGDQRGRIWRLEPPKFAHRNTPNLAEYTSEELVPLLAHPNAWHRETAHRLLWERQDISVAPAVRSLLKSSPSPLGRLHALWTLDGLDQLSRDDLILALRDHHPEVAAAAIRIAEPRAVANESLQQVIINSVDTSAYPVLEQLTLTLGEWKTKIAAEKMLELAASCQSGDLRTAWLSSIPVHAPSILKLAVSRPDAGTNPLIAETARTLGAGGSEYDLQAVIDEILQPSASTDLQMTLLSPLAAGLRLQGKSLTSVSTSGQSTDIAGRLEKFFQAVAQRVEDGKLPEKDRVSAIAMLGSAPAKLAVPALKDLLTPSTSITIQQTTVSSLSTIGGEPASELLIESFSSLSPALKKQITESLLSRQDWTKDLLTSISDKTIAAIEMPREQKEVLLNHPNSDIRSQARKVLASEIAGDRSAVIKKYLPTITGSGQAKRGHELYTKHCASCHQVGSEGKKVGPELASVKNKSPEDLLIAIMDPNREAQASYLSYSIVTDEGRVLTGIIAGETASAVTLRKAKGEEEIILRSQIDIMKSNGISLMPAGLEKELKPEDLNDLIAFIKSLEAPSK
ncbi:MAG: c-type cytochrome [Planctomycetaceae bacterium]|nr:c-type cytochrome [Planctomycetaceae bacterium]